MKSTRSTYARRGRGGHSKQRAATSDSLSPLSTSARGSALRLLPDAPFLAAKRDKIDSRNYEAEFPLRWMQKDMHLATVSAYEAGVAMPVTNVAKEIYRLAMRDGHDTEDFSAIYDYVASASRKDGNSSSQA